MSAPSVEYRTFWEVRPRSISCIRPTKRILGQPDHTLLLYGGRVAEIGRTLGFHRSRSWQRGYRARFVRERGSLRTLCSSVVDTVRTRGWRLRLVDPD